MDYTNRAPLPRGKTGLSDAEVAASKKQYGENRISRKKTRGFFARLIENFRDPMIRILLIALAINLLFLFNDADWYETGGIAVAVLVAVVISTVSEQGSERAFLRLSEEAAKIRCRVIREKGLIEVPVEEIVVGDLIRLEAGDKISADGFLIEGEISVDQSALNGETKESEKTALKTITAGSSTDLLNIYQVFSGTLVCSGQGIMRASAVGDTTFYGKLAGEIQEEKAESPLRERLAGLARTISRVGYTGALLAALAYLFNVIVLDNGFNHAKILAMLSNPAIMVEKILYAATLAVTVIVVAVPEGLPMMITVVLSSNMRRMLKDNVLVRKLIGIETAGSMNILLTDKTGTLTKGKLQLTDFIDGTGKVWGKSDGLPGQALWRELHRAIQFNSLAEMSGGKAVGGNTTDRALIEYIYEYPVQHRLKKGQRISFDSKIKYMATSVTGEESCTFIKGAPEIILPHCVEYTAPDGRIMPFSSKWALQKTMSEMQNNAVRLIAVAVSAQPVTARGDFGRLRLIGVAAIRDGIRREAIEGVRQIKQAGIQMVMITGDAKPTAEAIARQTGLLAGAGEIVLTSEEMAVLSDRELSNLLPRLRVVARALPQDKSRLVRIAQGAGLVTGMTGDGVNDAPALKHADIGFAMGSGNEIAKEAGDIVILDDNLLSIVKAVRYGRTIFKSIRKFIIFQLTLNFCALGVSVIAPFIGVDSPITVIQMLWINMVMDTLAGLAFGGEPALLRYMKEPPKRRDEPIINAYMWREIIFGGLFSILLCLWFLKSRIIADMFGTRDGIRFLTAFFALFMFSGIFGSFCARTHKINLLDHLAGNKPFIVIMGAVALIQLCIIYFGGSVFRTGGLPLNDLLTVILLSYTPVLMHFLRKGWYEWRGMDSGT